MDYVFQGGLSHFFGHQRTNLPSFLGIFFRVKQNVDLPINTVQHTQFFMYVYANLSCIFRENPAFILKCIIIFLSILSRQFFEFLNSNRY